jgi:intein/homing endonuclease
MAKLYKFIPDYKAIEVISALSETVDWSQQYTGVSKYREMMKTKGEGIKVVILDTGKPDHIDLNDNIKGAEDLTGNNDVADRQGHSSHCHGIVGGIDNDFGVIGIAPCCDLYAGKVLDNNGLCPGDYSWIIKGLEWAIDIKADVVNMSLGAAINPPDKLHQLIKTATDKGMILVAASGNEKQQQVDYPGRYEEVIAVAAMTQNGQIANYSNTGQDLDFIAPGSDIYSTYLNNGYAKLSGTCLPETSLILTPTGPKSLNELQPGDDVISCDPQSLKIIKNKINKKWSNGIKSLYKVKTGNWTLEATGNHPVLTLDVQNNGKKQGVGMGKQYNFIWKRVDELTISDYIFQIHEIDFKEDIFIDEVPNAEFAQFLGFMIGDGWISHPKTHMYMISFARGEYEKINDEYQEILSKLSINNVSVTKDKKQTYTYDKQLYYLLSHFGLGDGARNKYVPEAIFKCSQEIRKAFIIGYLDADGTSPRKKTTGTLCFSTASKKLAFDIKYLLSTVGAQTANIYHRYRTSTMPGGREIHGDEYAATICRSEDEKLFDIYNEENSRFKRLGSGAISSRVLMDMIVDSPFRLNRITSVEEIEEREVFDIEMSNNDYPSFIADGMVVHNSMSSPFIAGISALILAYHRTSVNHTTPVTNYKELEEHITRYEKGKLIDMGDGNSIGILDFGTLINDEGDVTVLPESAAPSIITTVPSDPTHLISASSVSTGCAALSFKWILNYFNKKAK